jgi:hypothetical protein
MENGGAGYPAQHSHQGIVAVSVRRRENVQVRQPAATNVGAPPRSDIGRFFFLEPAPRLVEK